MPQLGIPRERMTPALNWERISGNECPGDEGSSTSRIDPYNQRNIVNWKRELINIEPHEKNHVALQLRE